jgi:hypothetical protein
MHDARVGKTRHCQFAIGPVSESYRRTNETLTAGNFEVISAAEPALGRITAGEQQSTRG